MISFREEAQGTNRPSEHTIATRRGSAVSIPRLGSVVSKRDSDTPHGSRYQHGYNINLAKSRVSPDSAMRHSAQQGRELVGTLHNARNFICHLTCSCKVFPVIARDKNVAYEITLPPLWRCPMNARSSCKRFVELRK